MYTVELPILLDPVKVPENNIGGNSGGGGVGIKSHSMMCGDACTKETEKEKERSLISLHQFLRERTEGRDFKDCKSAMKIQK